MADVRLRSVKFPGLTDKYFVKDYDEDIETISEDLEEAQTALETKAEIDGYYDEMAVGSAEQLISTKFTEDSVPYKYRTSGGSADIGNRETDKIVGGTIAWNQHEQMNRNSNAENGINYTNNRDGSFTISGTATQNGSFFPSNTGTSSDAIIGHKYLASSDIKNPSMDYICVGIYVNNTPKKVIGTSSIIYSADVSGKIQIGYRYASGATIDSITVKGGLYDLTQMFGSTIADYIYSLEQASAGAGVTYFRKLFPKPYYEYNAGELISVEGLSAHEMIGFNQWDEEWELGSLNANGVPYENNSAIRSKNFAPVIEGATYYYHTGSNTSQNPWFYDSEKNFVTRLGAYVTNGTFVVPSGCHYIKFSFPASYGTTYKNDICLNLSWSGWRNGEYEPYVKHTYQLDSTLKLRGIPKLDSSNQLYYDGDTYESDGTVTRRYNLYTSFSRMGLDSSGKLYKIASLDKETPTALGIFGLSNLYPMAYLSEARANSDNGIKSICCYGNSIYISGFVGEETALDAILPNLQVVNQVVTPTIETAQPYTNPQIVDDFGTEEYVSTSICPVGHETQYMANLRDKLQHLPDLADADGYYMISQSNSQMTLEHFRIPKAPTTDGTYTLKATVSGGTPTYTWVDDSGESEG